MKSAILSALVLSLLAGCALAGDVKPIPAHTVSDFSLHGAIEGENITFDLAFSVDDLPRRAEIPLVIGDVAFLDGSFPRGAELFRRGDAYMLRFGWRRSGRIEFRFASRPEKQGDWRQTTFAVPSAAIRNLSVVCDRNDLEVRFPGALDVQSALTQDGKTRVTAFLGISDSFQVGWKPEIRRLDSELVVACEANTIATASVGALRLDTVFSYRVIQGNLRSLSLDLPAVNVIQVEGENIKEWRINRDEGGASRLNVELSRPHEGVYRLRVESEMFLPKFPCSFVLPVLAPRDVLRTSGFLMIGTDSAIKLAIKRAAGMTQVDQVAFPEVGMGGDAAAKRSRPSRSRFAYQYANTPYTLELGADDIVSSYTADNRLTLALAENELTFEASVDVDVRDAPAREIYIETDADAAWTVTGISGQQVSEPDTDVRTESTGGAGETRRVIYVPFKQAVSGAALLTIRMERSLAAHAATFTAPSFSVRGAKSERGYIVVSAEQGVRLKSLQVDGMREVHTGSAPMRVPGAQQAFRFKRPQWGLTMGIERTPASLHSEVFHLVSLGEGVLYASASITYHISGAPLQEFKVRVPAQLQNVEFTGADIEGWTRDGELHTVRLQARVMGDYTLLLTYDYQFPYAGAEIPLGVVETEGTESEVGYVALASSLSLKREHIDIPPSMIVIDKDEIPSAYTAPVTDPILEAFKYVRAPHTALLGIKPYATEQLLKQIADYTRLKTRFTKDGEAVTTVSYFVKNSSQQYLVLNLPEGVELWSIKLVGEDGVPRDVLSQSSDEGLLIPILRPRDPNTALRVDITYAESHAGMTAWNSAVSGIECRAPALPNSQATYASWEIAPPEGFSIAGAAGSMTPARSLRHVGFGRLGELLLSLGAAVLDGPGGHILRRVLKDDFTPPGEAHFVRTVNLSGGEPLGVRVFMAPEWLGNARSPRLLLGLLPVGLLLSLTMAAGRKLRVVWALGLAILVFGLAQVGIGRLILAGALALLLVWLVLRLVRCVAPLVWHLLRWCCRQVWRGLRDMRTRAYQRKLELRMAAAGTIAPEPEEPETPIPSDTIPLPDGPGKAPLVLCLLATVGTLLAGTPRVMAERPVMDHVTISVNGPAADRDAEPSAEVTMSMTFETESETRFNILPRSAVLVSNVMSSSKTSILPTDGGYDLVIKDNGDYKIMLAYRVPVQEDNGTWRLQLLVPSSIRNAVDLTLPQVGMDVRCPEAVLLRSRDEAQATRAYGVLGPARKATFTWQPRVRKTAFEDAVFFCEVNTLAVLQSGVVDLTSYVRYQIAQGELKDLKLRIPEGMSVTSVRAPGLATWRFDPASRLLEAVLEKAVAGDYLLTVVMQIASEGLPYTANVRSPDVLDAVRQRGSIAVAAEDDVQVRVAGSGGVNPMNIEDFPQALTAAQQKERESRGRRMTVRRAFRYGKAGVADVSVEAEKVLPEVRVAELGTLSIADERIVLATKLTLSVAKSGIFSVPLEIPADYDVETLTGPDVSHWDESGSNAAAVVVHFTRQVLDSTEINLVVARTEKGIDDTIDVPRVAVSHAAKRRGRLTVSGERGVRLMVNSHRGVDVLKSSEEGIRQTGVLVFDILRPAWSIVLRTDVLTPVVKPEVLQWVDLAEGMLQCRVFLQYHIENAGVKTFRIQSPQPGASLAFTGRQIARVAEIDKEAGVWQVDLHGKVEDRFSMTATYQVPYDPASRQVSIVPLQTLDTEDQRGYVVVTCAGRVQVQASGSLQGLKVEDPRTVPSSFGAGDLSSAILCYRALRPDYDLQLSVVRHGSAGVLPASIERARFVSVLSASGDLLTRADLNLRVGNLRLLRVTLPSAEDSLWTVLVDGSEVATSRDGEAYCIPLVETEGNETSSVELIYAAHARSSGLSKRWEFSAPTFGLPLTDIDWRFYAPAEWRCSRFGGNMEHKVQPDDAVQVFDSDRYLAYNEQQRNVFIENARQVLDAGEELMKSGQQKRARKAFEVALNYSQGQDDLNEDARVQLRNVMKQQVKMGLVNRRDALRFSRNIIDEQQMGQMQGFQDGDFTQEYAANVEQRLSTRDNDALDVVANKIIEQQAAAAGVVTAIRVTMPKHGRSMTFSRRLQIDPDSPLTVSFSAGSAGVMGLLEPGGRPSGFSLPWRSCQSARHHGIGLSSTDGPASPCERRHTRVRQPSPARDRAARLFLDHGMHESSSRVHRESKKAPAPR